MKGNEDPEQLTKIDFIVEHDFEVKTMVKYLPKYIKISDVLPGEPRLMKLRKPCVARLHKYNKIKNPHEFYYSELQLYKPFHCEEMLSPNSLDKCEELYEEKSEHNSKRKISNVKNILMEYLETVEEGTEKTRNTLESNAGTLLDNAMEQENADCEEEGIENHEDFLHKDIDLVENAKDSEVSGTLYKKIELYSDAKINEITLQLDCEQRMVLDIAVDYANNLVKAKKGGISIPNAPLIVVQGGAGTG